MRETTEQEAMEHRLRAAKEQVAALLAERRQEFLPSRDAGSGGPPATSADVLYEALFWISEYPNREHVYSEEDGIRLAEYAREALNRYEASSNRRSPDAETSEATG